MKGWMGRFRALFLLSGLTLLLSGCGKPYLSALQPKGEGSEMLFNLMLLSIGIMIFVFLVVMVIYIYVVLKFRQKKGQEDHIPKQTEGSHVLETIWTVIPIILLLILAVPTVQYTFALSDTKNVPEDQEDAIWIEVTGQQYWWHFDYKDLNIQTSQELYIPTDQRVYLELTSKDVIHSFWIPTISGKMDTNPIENKNEMWIHAYEEGVYWGKCAELCGPSHSLMDFKVVAVSPGEFEQWVEDMQNVNPDEEPETVVAKEGKELFQQNSCAACHAVGSSPVAVGPNLTSFGDRTTVAGIMDYNKENIVNWLMDPEKYKPGNKMSNNYPALSEEEAGKIAEYLMTLKPSEIGLDDAEDGDYIKSQKDENNNEENTQDQE